VLYEGILGDSGLHATQFTALQFLDAAPNLTTTELAEAIGVDQTTATRTLALIKRLALQAIRLVTTADSAIGARAQGRSAIEETETPLGGAKGYFRRAAGTDARQGAERGIVPRRQ
jgi:hypothetical protein